MLKKSRIYPIIILIKTISFMNISKIFSSLSDWQISQIARHPLRPYTLDYIENMFSSFTEIHGDRMFGDDKAIICGFAMLDDKPNVIRWAHLNFRDITLYDFGLPVKENDNTAAVQSKIKEIEETFDLIMIVEHFDESTVLLKHLLCWEYSDLTSLKLNVHDEKSKSIFPYWSRLNVRDRAEVMFQLKSILEKNVTLCPFICPLFCPK